MFTRFVKLSRAFAVIALLGLSLTMVGQASASVIPVPQQVSPADGATLNSTRSLTFSWDTVSWSGPGEAKYGIEIQYLDSSSNWHNAQTAQNVIGADNQVLYTFANFTNSDYGRWRVRTMTSQGNSDYSGWRLFNFNSGIPHTPIPPAVGQAHVHDNVPAHLPADITAPCPSGTLVTGGGWQVSAGHQILQSRQSGNGWMVKFQYDGAAYGVDVYAECLSGVSGYIYSAAAHITIPGVSSGNDCCYPHADATAQCNSGAMTSGGFAADYLVVVNWSRPQNGTWVVDGTNSWYSAKLLHAYATCLVSSGATSHAASGSNFIPGGQLGGATANCSNSSLAVGGGFDPLAVLGGFGPISQPVLINATNTNGWTAWGYNPFSHNITFKTYAMCLSVN
jgi:hypothetical protein